MTLRAIVMSDGSAETLEHCINFCEETLRRFGVRTLAGDRSDGLYGRAFLEVLDSNARVIRPYPRSSGNAEFRSFCRSYGLEYAAEIADLLVAFRELTPYIRRHLSKPDFMPPEVTERYIHQILLNDIVAWPDALFAGFEYDLTDLGRGLESYSVTPDFADLYSLWGEEASPREAVRNALDLVCLGPWIGISITRITEALHKLGSELNRGAPKMTVPLYACLKAGQAWQLKLPLLCDGLQGDLIVSIGCGPLSRLKGQRGDLIRDLTMLADVMAACLAKWRMRRAVALIRRDLAQGETAETYSGLAEAMDHVIAPHQLNTLRVDGQIVWPVVDSAGTGKVSPRFEGGRMQVSHDFKIRDRRFRAEVAQHSLSTVLKTEIEAISIRDRLENVLIHFAAESADRVERATSEERASQEHDSYSAAEVLLEKYRNSTVSRKEFFACFVALTLLQKGGQMHYTISGQRVRQIQRQLESEHAILRQRAPRQDGESPEQRKESFLSIAQMAPSSQDLRSVEAQIGNIRLERSHGSLRVTVSQPRPSGEPVSDAGTGQGDDVARAPQDMSRTFQ